MYPEIFFEALKKKLSEPLPGRSAQMRFAPPHRMPLDAPPPGQKARQSAVLVTLFEHQGQLCTLLIRRTDDGRAHGGQISFPGGKWEPTDGNLEHTALREAWEEVGIVPQSVRILGQMTDLYIPVSNFMVQPVVGALAELPELCLSANEVAEVLVAPLDELFDTTRHLTKRLEIRGNVLNVPAIDWRGHIVWGATAIMLGELWAIYERLFYPKRNEL